MQSALADSDPTVRLAGELIACPSISPEDHGAQEVLIKFLRRLGFQTERVEHNGRKNLWAEIGENGPLFAFSGHTDVVPAGEISAWSSPPFEPVLREGKLYGRGAQDMKGQIAAFCTATERFLLKTGSPTFRLGFLIAGDEEHDFNFGTNVLLNYLEQKGKRIDLALVGEPTSEKLVGDTIKIGRRGSVTGILRIFGKQGHAAHPHKAQNAISLSLPIVNELMALTWDSGNEHFVPSTFQITNLRSGTGVANVIPGLAEIVFNVRYSNELTGEGIEERIAKLVDEHSLSYELEWIHGAKPFLTKKGPLIELVSSAVSDVLAREPQLSTSGGTSDARFLAARGIEVVELGMTNDTIHKIDECVALEELQQISAVYEQILVRLNQSSSLFENRAA